MGIRDLELACTLLETSDDNTTKDDFAKVSSNSKYDALDSQYLSLSSNQNTLALIRIP